MKVFALFLLLHFMNLGVSQRSQWDFSLRILRVKVFSQYYWDRSLENKGRTSFSEQFISGNLISLRNNMLTSSSSLEGLSKYPKLMGLNLEHNRIASLDMSLYKCTELELLYISNNRITDIQLAFATNIALRVLTMSHNLLTSLNAYSFFNLVNLQALNLANNQITTLEKGVFANTRALRILHLQHNKLTSLQTSSFLKLVNLVMLDLNHNQIKTIETGVFNNTRALTTLNLHYNKLTSLQASSFRNLVNLEMLHLNHNQIKKIQRGLFVKQVALKYLYLQNNRLRVIFRSTFKTPNLRKLYLNDNLISEVQDNAFSSMNMLEYLYLQNNELETYNCIISCTEVKESDSNHLRRLDLRKNKLSKIPHGLRVLMKVYGVADLRTNNITSLPKAIIDYVYTAEIKLRLEGNHHICICPDVWNSTFFYHRKKYILHSCIEYEKYDRLKPEDKWYVDNARYEYPTYFTACTTCHHC